MEQYAELGERRCANCGTQLRGRTDKRFCNDTCRNNFNRKKRREANELIPDTYREIFRIIKQNHHILLKALGYDAEVETSRSKLAEAGFHFKYFTSTVPEREMVWHCCFDIGWGVTADDWALSTDKVRIGRFPKAADPDNYEELIFG